MVFYDYLILGFYFVFIVGIGFLFRGFNTNISEYLRGGGSMLWWMCGASSMMGSLSVWSFTGAASKTYEGGLVVLIFPACFLVSQLVVLLFTCYRFRQMRVMTSVEAIRRRYGGTNEQLFVWLQLPLGLVGGAVGLNTLGVFISSVFGANLVATVVVVGIVVVFVASSGGAWAVVAGDFVQMLLMLLVVSVAAFLALSQPEIGGLGGLLHKLPATHTGLNSLGRPSVVLLWGVAILFQTVFMANDLSTGAARFMAVKDGVHARKAALMALILGLLFPLLLYVPPLVSVVLFPDIAARFPSLTNPSEAAYVAVCLKTMPHGLLGLMVSGIFAAAMAGMDVGLNRNAGIFVKNFYGRIWRPQASQRELLMASRVFTTVFGALMILAAIYIASVRSMNLFDFVIMIGSLVGLPLVVPMTWGLFVRRTPAWTGWSTALVGFLTAATAKWWIGVSLAAWVLGLPAAGLHRQEAVDLQFVTTALLVLGVGSAWFFFTMLFAGAASERYKAEVDAFFRDMRTPIDPVAEKIVYDDGRQYKIIGRLCLVYGVAMLAGTLIPNPLRGRLCFAYIAGAMLLIGGLLHRKYVAGLRRGEDSGRPSLDHLQAAVAGLAPTSHEGNAALLDTPASKSHANED